MDLKFNTIAAAVEWMQGAGLTGNTHAVVPAIGGGFVVVKKI